MMPSTPDPEILCRKCGRCCYFKVTSMGDTWITKIPCKFLDPVTKLCDVYSQRDTVPWCCNPIPAIQRGEPVLPSDCPLVAAFGPPDYTGPKELP